MFNRSLTVFQIRGISPIDPERLELGGRRVQTTQVGYLLTVKGKSADKEDHSCFHPLFRRSIYSTISLSVLVKLGWLVTLR